MKNKCILLIGSSGGLGTALVNLLHDSNKLILAGSSLTNQNDFENSVLKRHLDLKEVSSIHNLSNFLIEHNIVLDGIIFNAGINKFSGIDTLSEEAIINMIDINLKGCIFSNKILMKNLHLDGFICNISSVLGNIGMPGYSVYSATKAGIKLFSESLRRELSDSNIKVIYYQPRAIHTTMNSDKVVEMNRLLKNKVDDPEHVAIKIIKSIESEKNGIFSFPENIFSHLNNIFPRIIDGDFKKKLELIKKYF
jgi:short-subunit dehydrogenase